MITPHQTGNRRKRSAQGSRAATIDSTFCSQSSSTLCKVRNWMWQKSKALPKGGQTVVRVTVQLRIVEFFYRTRVRSLAMLVSDWLTDSCLVNLIDVTLACEDANSKLVDVVTVADEDRVGNNLLLRFGQAFEFEVQARLAAGVWPVFSADVLKRLWRWILVEILKPGLVKILKF